MDLLLFNLLFKKEIFPFRYSCMGDAVFDKAPDDVEETEDTEEIEEVEDEDEDAYVITRDDDFDIFNNLSLKHNEQTPGDC